jgi:hypothetical protein
MKRLSTSMVDVQQTATVAQPMTAARRVKRVGYLFISVICVLLGFLVPIRRFSFNITHPLANEDFGEPPMHETPFGQPMQAQIVL